MMAFRKKSTKKKTTIGSSSSHDDDFFQNLSEEVKIEVLRRLSIKELSIAMCVSKPWRQLIILNFLPYIARILNFNYTGKFLLGNLQSSGLSMVNNETERRHSLIGPYEYVKFCSTIMQSKATSQKLLDLCNGLLLFCQRQGDKLYYYYVINPITKQCIMVTKPSPRTARFMCACLAYDPMESSYLRIVQFQGCRRLNIFSSETGDWMALNLRSHLPEEVKRAVWDKNLIYNQGGIYRLSSPSGHVVKFQIDDDNDKHYHHRHVVAIKFPSTHLPSDLHTIYVRNKKVVFASMAQTFLVLWELEEQYDGDVRVGECRFNWNMLYRFERNMTISRGINDVASGDAHLVAVQPYFKMAYYTGKPYVVLYEYSEDRREYREVGVVSESATTFPIVECTVPFTCSLDTMTKDTFKRLPIKKSRLIINNPYYFQEKELAFGLI
ncbi:F-box protein [Senna tora]|uniref:F-box protein n=1 Tax=Senna tora TaxID=362788 RepID=A0A834XGT0_9FABA|nr:F-box protein [Senna tora]